jgi:hypothetical protein
MPLFCTSLIKYLETDWFSEKTDARMKAFAPGDYDMVDEYIKQFFDAHAIQGPMMRVCVPINCPHPWPTALVPVWIACNYDEEDAAMFLGGLYCRHAIKRPELWWTAPLPFTKRLSEGGERIIGPARHYVMQPMHPPH